MNERRSNAAERARLERTLEAIADGEGGYDLVFNPATGQVVPVEDGADEDRLPATQMAREGFFCGPVRLAGHCRAVAGELRGRSRASLRKAEAVDGGWGCGSAGGTP